MTLCGLTHGRGLIQVAGVRGDGEAAMLRDLGVDLIGFPLRLAVHSPDLDESEARAVIRRTDIAGRAVLITYLNDPDEIRELAQWLNVCAVQLHGDMALEALGRLRRAGGLGIIKSLIVRDSSTDALLEYMRACEPWVDAFITDTFDPATGATGATGKVHDWAVSEALARVARRPLILAGGLKPANVARAIERVRPAGVDAHTGLEDADGAKSRDKVERFVTAARTAFAEIESGG
jgi:phosphoribosylanthranilate isomerase